MNLQIVLLTALVLFASTVTIAAISFHMSTPDEVWKNIYSNSMVLASGGSTPCEPINDEGPPVLK